MSVALSHPVPSPSPSNRLIALRDQLWPIADQALLSGTNLTTTILLARALSTAEFGAFALAYASLMLAGGLQAALITQPHNVLGASHVGEAYRRYTTTAAFCQLLLAALCSLAVLIGWAAGQAAAWFDVSLLLPLAGTVFAWQLQEFVRRVLYTEGRVPAALVNDSLAYGGQLLLLGASCHASSLTAARALHIITASSLLAAALGGWQLRRDWTRRADWRFVRENWDYGKWLLGACIASDWLATQLFLFVAAIALGSGFAGAMRAFQTIFGPARILAQAISASLPTRLARAAAAGGQTAWNHVWRGTLWLAIPLLTGYCLLVTVVSVPLLTLVFGHNYAEQAGALGLYSLASWLGYLTVLGAAALRSRNRTRAVFVCEIVSLIAIPPSLPLIPWLGLPGVIVGMIAADLALCALLWRAGPWRESVP